MSVREKGLTAWANFNVPGVPGSGDKEPKKSEIRVYVNATADALADISAAITAGGDVVTVNLLSDLTLSHAAGKLAFVLFDPTAANNGVYRKSGASGAGSWVKTEITLASEITAQFSDLQSTVGDLQTAAEAATEGSSEALTKANQALAASGNAQATASGIDAKATQALAKANAAEANTASLLPRQNLIAQAPSRFTAAVAGDGFAQTAITLDKVVTTVGQGHRLSNGVVAMRERQAIVPDRIYSVSWLFERLTDQSDSVDLGFEWLDANYNSLGHFNYATLTPIVRAQIISEQTTVSKTVFPSAVPARLNFRSNSYEFQQASYSTVSAAITGGALAFARASASTYITDRSEAVQTVVNVSSGTVANGNSGVLLRGTLTNVARYSSSLDMWSRVGSVIFPNIWADPYGTGTADYIKEAPGAYSVYDATGRPASPAVDMVIGTSGRVVMCGGAAYVSYSDDFGATWTQIAAPGGGANNWASIAWSPTLSLFVMVSGDGTQRLATSPDGVTWTLRNSADDTKVWRGVCWSSDRAQFVAISTGGAAYSANGTSWTLASNPVNGIDTYDICWCGAPINKYVAATLGGVVVTSPDGNTWTTVSVQTGLWITSVAFSPLLGIAVGVATTGTGQRACWSANGSDWYMAVTPADNGYWRVRWSAYNGFFLATSRTGSDKRLMRSIDGKTWQSLEVATSEYWQPIADLPSRVVCGSLSDDVGSPSTRVMFVEPIAAAHTATTTFDGAIASGDLVTWSAYLAYDPTVNGARYVQLGFSSNISATYINVDMTNGTISGTGGTIARSGIQRVRSGLYRVFIEAASVGAVSSGAGSGYVAIVAAANSARQAARIGQGLGVFVSGAMAVTASAGVASAFRFRIDDPIIETTSAAVTRAADQLTIKSPNGTYDLVVTYLSGQKQTISGLVASGGAGVAVPASQLTENYIQSIDLVASNGAIRPPDNAVFMAPYIRSNGASQNSAIGISVTDITDQMVLPEASTDQINAAASAAATAAAAGKADLVSGRLPVTQAPAYLQTAGQIPLIQRLRRNTEEYSTTLNRAFSTTGDGEGLLAVNIAPSADPFYLDAPVYIPGGSKIFGLSENSKATFLTLDDIDMFVMTGAGVTIENITLKHIGYEGRALFDQSYGSLKLLNVDVTGERSTNPDPIIHLQGSLHDIIGLRAYNARLSDMATGRRSFIIDWERADYPSRPGEEIAIEMNIIGGVLGGPGGGIRVRSFDGNRPEGFHMSLVRSILAETVLEIETILSARVNNCTFDQGATRTGATVIVKPKGLGINSLSISQTYLSATTSGASTGTCVKMDTTGGGGITDVRIEQCPVKYGGTGIDLYGVNGLKLDNDYSDLDVGVKLINCTGATISGNVASTVTKVLDIEQSSGAISIDNLHTQYGADLDIRVSASGQVNYGFGCTGQKLSGFSSALSATDPDGNGGANSYVAIPHFLGRTPNLQRCFVSVSYDSGGFLGPTANIVSADSTAVVAQVFHKGIATSGKIRVNLQYSR